MEQIQAKYTADRTLDEAIVAARRADYKRANQLFDTAVEVFAKSGLLQDDKLGAVHFASGVLSLVQNDCEKARIEFERGAAVAERTKGKDSDEAITARRYSAISDIHSGKNFERAGAALKNVQVIYLQRDMSKTPEYRSVLGWLAVCAIKSNHFPEAIRYQQELCDNLRSQEKVSEIDLAGATHQLAELYEHEKDFDTARNYYDQAAELHERLRGTDDVDAKSARAQALAMSQAGAAPKK